MPKGGEFPSFIGFLLIVVPPFFLDSGYYLASQGIFSYLVNGNVEMGSSLEISYGWVFMAGLILFFSGFKWDKIKAWWEEEKEKSE